MDAASAASAVVEQQPQKQMTSQKSKKKSKNKKSAGKNYTNAPPGAEELNHCNKHVNTIENGNQQDGEKESAGTTLDSAEVNGLCEKIEQQLHIAAHDDSQLNGAAENFCTHVSHNGHYTPAFAAGDKSNGTCESAVQKQRLPQQNTQLQQSMNDGNGKKSKSKSNRKNNKEATRQIVTKVVTSSNGEKCATDNDDLHCVSAAVTIVASAEKEQEAAIAVQLENGFSHKNNDPTNTNKGAVFCNDNSNGNISQRMDTHHVCPGKVAEEAEPSATHPDEGNTNTRNIDAEGILVPAMTRSNCNTQSVSQLPTAVTNSTTNNINANLTAKQSSNTAKPKDAATDNATVKISDIARNPVEDTPVTTTTAKTKTDTKTMDASGTTIVSATAPAPALDLSNVHIEYKEYASELQMHDIMRLIQAELSEPYSIYTYRYFIYNWPKLCFLAAHGDEYVGAIVCKLDMHMNVRRGYIAMLAVRKEYRKLKIGTTLVQKAIEAMLADNADEVVLETEMRNVPALRLYENLGFVRDKRLFRYYLNGVDALRLKLWFR